MMHNRSLNNKINHIHQRALRIVYNDYSFTFENLLNKDKSVTIIQRNLQQLAIEIFKVKIRIAPKIMNEIFTFVENSAYNLRSGMHLSRINMLSTQYDTESIGNFGAKTWILVPVHMKDLKALSTLKNQIKKWIPKNCPCRLCKVYVAQVGFLQKLLGLFASFNEIQYCLFYSFSCFLLFYFIYFFIRFIILFMLFMYFYFISFHVFIYFINLFIYLFIYLF